MQVSVSWCLFLCLVVSACFKGAIKMQILLNYSIMYYSSHYWTLTVKLLSNYWPSIVSQEPNGFIYNSNVESMKPVLLKCELKNKQKQSKCFVFVCMPLPRIPSRLQAIIKKIKNLTVQDCHPNWYTKNIVQSHSGGERLSKSLEIHILGGQTLLPGVPCLSKSHSEGWWCFSLKVSQFRWKTADLETLLLYQL